MNPAERAAIEAADRAAAAQRRSYALLREARDFLRSCGIGYPDDDVKLLAAFAAGRPLKDALGAPPAPFDERTEAEFRRLLERRGRRHEPCQYLVGSEEFLGLEIKVTPAVLIPRPSTESLVERAGPPGRFLDVGTGSGAIAVALATLGWRGVATDISGAAIEIALENAVRLGVADRVVFVRADLWAEGRFDLVIANPPYVTTAEMASLPPEVLHEPREALHGGADGLDVVRRVIAGAPARAPRLLLECAPGQMAEVRRLALEAGFRTVEVSKDLDGFDRVVDARR